MISGPDHVLFAELVDDVNLQDLVTAAGDEARSQIGGPDVSEDALRIVALHVDLDANDLGVDPDRLLRRRVLGLARPIRGEAGVRHDGQHLAFEFAVGTADGRRSFVPRRRVRGSGPPSPPSGPSSATAMTVPRPLTALTWSVTCVSEIRGGSPLSDRATAL